MPTRWGTTAHDRECERCGTAVSRQFIKVFGIGDDVHGCIDCMTRTELSEGLSAQPADGRGEALASDGVETSAGENGEALADQDAETSSDRSPSDGPTVTRR